MVLVWSMQGRIVSDIVKCSLCGIELPNEAPRLSRHHEWHSKAWVQHRNTTQGIPEWYVVE